MAKDHNLVLDEDRRIEEHEAVKGKVREKVHEEIAREARREEPAERARAEELADSLKRKAVTEVAVTEAELTRGRFFARVSQVVDYLFYLAYGIIGLEIVLEAIGANDSAGFKRFIDAAASPLLAPFRGLMPTPGVGRFRFWLSGIVALAVYILLHLAVNGLFRLFVVRKTEV